MLSSSLQNSVGITCRKVPLSVFLIVLSVLTHLRIGDPKAIHPYTHQHAMLNPTPRRLPLCSSLGDPYPFRPFHGSKPIAACPPHALRSAATSSKPAPARHDHSPAHHGYVHHHGNHLVAGHGQPGRAQFHQRGQLRLVRK